MFHSFLFSRPQLREAFLTRLSSSLLTSSSMYSHKLLKYLSKLLSLNNTLYRLFHAVRPSYSFHVNVNLIFGRLVSFLSLFVSLSYQLDSLVSICKPVKTSKLTKQNIIYKMLILKLITDTCQSKSSRSDYSMLREFERTIPANKIEITPRC